MPIQIEHLTHAYMPDSPFTAIALEDVNLTIEDGEFIGLLGHTGSGKTTLVQHLNGLLKPTSGRIVVDGLDITEKGVSLIEVRKKIGLVFQYPEYQLFEETVAKDVALKTSALPRRRSTAGYATHWNWSALIMTTWQTDLPLSSAAVRCAVWPLPACLPWNLRYSFWTSPPQALIPQAAAAFSA